LKIHQPLHSSHSQPRGSIQAIQYTLKNIQNSSTFTKFPFISKRICPSYYTLISIIQYFSTSTKGPIPKQKSLSKLLHDEKPYSLDFSIFVEFQFTSKRVCPSYYTLKKHNPRFLNLCKAPIHKQKSLTHHNKMGIFATLDILQTTNLTIESVVQATIS
jgi:hypothetical protein